MTQAYTDYLIVYCEVLLQAFLYTAILFFSVRREMGSDEEVLIFRAFLSSLMLALIIDGFTHAQYRGALHMPPGVVAFLYASYMFLFSGVLPFLWFNFAEVRLGSRFIRRLVGRILSIIPLAIVSMMCFASIKTGWFFEIDDEGIYTRGNLWAVQTGVSYLYFLFTTVHAIIKAKSEPSPMQRKQYYILSMYLIAPFIGGLLQLFVGNHPFVAPATGIAMLFIFLNIQGSLINNDTLTGLYNRKSAERYLEDLKLHASARNPFYLYMMDIDGFKGINDTYGHIEGDKALRIAANVLRKVADEYRGFVCRLGGDEFLAAIESKNISDPDDFEKSFIAAMSKEAQLTDLPYELKMSFGFTKCESPATSMNNMIADADEKMYKKKEASRPVSLER